MKLIDSKVELLEQGQGLNGVLKQIELCGRTCYKSEDHITEDSYKRFVSAMIKNGHTAMLEHGTIYLQSIVDRPNTLGFTKYSLDPYSKVNLLNTDEGLCAYITTNYRVIIQNHWEDDLKYICEPTEHHAKRYTFRITCSRIQSQSICRHRHFSFAQESTRYCNYSKDKFDREIVYVKPSWLSIPTGKVYWYDGINWRIQYGDNVDDTLSINPNNMPENEAYSISKYFDTLSKAEQTYFDLIEQGWKAESARDVLPNALKTEICVTGFEDDWEHFLDLRYYEKTGKPHPDMHKIAEAIYKHFYPENEQ